MNAGKIIVVTFAFLTVTVGAASYVLISRGWENARVNQAGIGLAKVQKAAAVWAQEEGGGGYPAHVALLRPNNYFNRILLNDPRELPGSVWTVGDLDARPFMDEPQRASVRDPLDRSPLVTAVEQFSRDHGSTFYRFGDYWFVRLDRYRNDPELIYGWTVSDDEGRRFLVFDNGEARRVGPDMWGTAWKNDAAARARLGLEAINTPTVMN